MMLAMTTTTMKMTLLITETIAVATIIGIVALSPEP